MSEPELISISPTEEMCINLANRLIRQCSVRKSRVTCIDNIDCDLIVLLFEAITGSAVPDLLICEDKVEEAHNVQAVIDTLSLDILGISLSHITGEAIVARDLVAIFNLLQVLEGVMLCSFENKNFSKLMKRKVSKIKKRQSDMFKENVCDRKTGTSSAASYENIRLNVPSSVSSESKSLHSKAEGLKPALTKTRFRFKGSPKPYARISSKFSLKESSVSSPDANLKFPEKQKKTSEKKSASTIINPSLEDANIVTSVQDVPTNTPVLLEESVFSERDLQGTDQLINRPNDFASSAKPVLIKRKISKLPHKKDEPKKVFIEKDVEKMYEENFESKIKALIQTNRLCKSRSSQMRRNHLQLMKKPLKKPPLSPCRKSFLLPYALRRKSVARPLRQSRSQSHLHSDKHITKERPAITVNESSKGFIQELLEEFPSIQLSPTLMNHIRSKYEQQLLKMHRQVKDRLLKKSKADFEAEKAAERQLVISDMLKKDVQNQQYLEEVKDKKRNENKIKYRLRDSRLKSAKMKQYCREFQDEMRKKMLKQNIAEELIFEKVFKEAMNIQKEHVNYLCQQVKETGEEDAKQYLNYLTALENLYRTQFAILSETIANEKKDAVTRVNAEKLELDKMQRDFQQVLKKEIRYMQKTIVELTEDCHFRELDAEQYIEEFRKQYT